MHEHEAVRIRKGFRLPSTIIKNIPDSEKTFADTENAKKPQTKEGAKLFISTIALLLTALALIFTLVFQINQTKENYANQIQSEEDLAWRNVLAKIGSRDAGDNLTLPTLIKSFYTSPKYGSEAKQFQFYFWLI